MLFMLGVLGVTGSILFAAEQRTSPPVPSQTQESTPPGSQSTPVSAAPQSPGEQSSPDEASEEEATEEGAPPAAAQAGKEDEEEEIIPPEDQDPAPRPGAVAGGSSPQRFTPSEQVRADFDVSFPIDI